MDKNKEPDEPGKIPSLSSYFDKMDPDQQQAYDQYCQDYLKKVQPILTPMGQKGGPEIAPGTFLPPPPPPPPIASSPVKEDGKSAETKPSPPLDEKNLGKSYVSPKKDIKQPEKKVDKSKSKDSSSDSDDDDQNTTECVICNQKFENSKAFHDHCRGLGHMTRAMNANKEAYKMQPSPAKPPQVPKSHPKPPVPKPMPTKKREFDPKINMTSSGKKPSVLSRLDESEDTNECKVCNQKFENLKAYQEHSRGVGHMNKMLLLGRSSGLVAKEPALPVAAPPHRKPEERVGFKKDLYCDVCQINTSCEDAMRDHLIGKKHKKNLNKFIDLPEEMKNQAMEPPSLREDVRTNMVDTNQTAVIQVEVDHFSGGPLIGLEHLVEIVCGNSVYHYFCDLCESKFDSNAIFKHLIGIKHRTEYLKQVRSDMYGAIFQQDRSDKEEIKKLCSVKAMEIEREMGRPQIRQRRIRVMSSNFDRIPKKTAASTPTSAKNFQNTLPEQQGALDRWRKKKQEEMFPPQRRTQAMPRPTSYGQEEEEYDFYDHQLDPQSRPQIKHQYPPSQPRTPRLPDRAATRPEWAKPVSENKLLQALSKAAISSRHDYEMALNLRESLEKSIQIYESQNDILGRPQGPLEERSTTSTPLSQQEIKRPKLPPPRAMLDNYNFPGESHSSVNSGNDYNDFGVVEDNFNEGLQDEQPRPPVDRRKGLLGVGIPLGAPPCPERMPPPPEVKKREPQPVPVPPPPSDQNNGPPAKKPKTVLTSAQQEKLSALLKTIKQTPSSGPSPAKKPTDEPSAQPYTLSSAMANSSRSSDPPPPIFNYGDDEERDAVPFDGYGNSYQAPPGSLESSRLGDRCSKNSGLLSTPVPPSQSLYTISANLPLPPGFGGPARDHITNQAPINPIKRKLGSEYISR